MVKAPSIRYMKYNYLMIKKQVLKNKKIIEFIKGFFVALFFISSLIAYGYFVNVASTKGYFIRQEREKLSEIKFQNEIVQIDVRKIESAISNQAFSVVADNDLTGKVFTIYTDSQVAGNFNFKGELFR